MEGRLGSGPKLMPNGGCENRPKAQNDFDSGRQNVASQPSSALGSLDVRPWVGSDYSNLADNGCRSDHAAAFKMFGSFARIRGDDSVELVLAGTQVIANELSDD